MKLAKLNGYLNGPEKADSTIGWTMPVTGQFQDKDTGVFQYLFGNVLTVES